MSSRALQPDAPAAPDPDEHSPQPRGDDGAAERGGLEIRPRAVERIITAAAAEVGPAASPVHRVLGQAVGRPDVEGRPRVSATVAGELVTGDLTMSVPWPAPVVEVADEVRRRVAARLEALAGMRVGHLDITVTALSRGRASRRVD